jgi:hypothetical protein
MAQNYHIIEGSRSGSQIYMSTDYGFEYVKNRESKHFLKLRCSLYGNKFIKCRGSAFIDFISSKRVSFDGTFASCPKLFKQVFIMFGIHRSDWKDFQSCFLPNIAEIWENVKYQNCGNLGKNCGNLGKIQI